VALAKQHQIKPAHLAIIWVKDQPGITAPLAGPRTLDQIKDIIPLMEKELSLELKGACDELIPSGSAVADFLNTAPWMKGKLL